MLMVTQGIVVSDGYGLRLGVLALLMTHKGTFSSEFCFERVSRKGQIPPVGWLLSRWDPASSESLLVLLQINFSDAYI